MTYHVRRSDFDVGRLMAGLATRRPIFHSEADFQHALAWEIQLRHPESSIRLETRPARGVRLDLLVTQGDHRTAIELKYLIRRVQASVDSELFDLPNQGAHDISRHDVCKDIWRVEKMIAAGYADSGYGIVLTNDGGYWRPGSKTDPIDALFRIHEGRTIQGVLGWGPLAGPGTTRSRLEPLDLLGSYTCRWQTYSNVPLKTGGQSEFRYLCHVISPAPKPEHLEEGIAG